MLVVLGMLLPELAYGDFYAVRTGMKQPFTDFHIKPYDLVLIQGHSDAPMPSLEDETVLSFSPFIHHHAFNDLEDDKRLCA